MKTVSNKTTKNDIINSMGDNDLRLKFYRMKTKTFMNKTSKDLKRDMVICDHYITEFKGFLFNIKDSQELVDLYGRVKIQYEYITVLMNKIKIKTALAA